MGGDDSELRVVPVTLELQGEILARPIVNASGQVLLAAGVELTRPLIESLLVHGVTRVAVRDWLLDDVEIDDAICEETRARATRHIARVMRMAAAGQPADIKQLEVSVRAIVSELGASENVWLSLSALRYHDDYTSVHSVNVCILSVLMAMELGYQRAELVELGLGAMLHDLGKIRIPREILGKQGPLKGEEWKKVQAHPWEGYNLLVRHVGVSYVAAHAALDHHERWNGTGYPRGLEGKVIPLIGRIVAIADVYDAITTDRAYRRRIPSHLALQHLLAKVGVLYDSRLVESFCRRVVPYPVGTVVRLDTGVLAVVVAHNPRDGWRPRVRVLSDPGLQPAPPQEIELADFPDLGIAEVLEDYPPVFKKRLSQRTAATRSVSPT